MFVSFVLLFYFTRTRPADPIQDLHLVGEIGYMAVGKEGIVVLDFSDRENLISIAEYDTLGTANAVLEKDERVYVADGSNGLLILSKKALLGNSEETITLGNFKTPGRALDVAIKGNFAYIVDSSGDIWIVNVNKLVTNPNAENGKQQKIPDKAEKIQIQGNRAYITTNKDDLQIYTLEDQQTLQNPATYHVGSPIHNFVVVGNERAYLAADSKGLVVLNISELSEIKPEGDFVNVKDAIDVDLRGNYAYVASGKSGFFVLDISDISSITQVGHETSPANAHLIRVKDDYVYIADDRDGLRIFQSPILFDSKKQEETNNLGVFSDVTVIGDYAYVAAGDNGLRVINVEDPSAPVGVYFDDGVDGFATALDAEEDYLYVLYRQKGLRIFSVYGTANSPQYDNAADTPGEANDLFVRGEFVYIADGPKGLQIVDLRNFAKPEIYSEDTPGNASGVFALGEYAYIADGGEGLQIILVSDPEKPTLVKKIATPGDARSVFVSKLKNSAEEERIYAFIADGSAGLYIVDVTNPDQPVNIATYGVKSFASDVIVQNQTVYLAERDDGLILLDISNITEPTLISNQPTPGDALGIYSRDELVYVADGKRGLRVVDISEMEKIKEIGFFDIPERVNDIVARKDFGYMVDGEDGMWVMDLSNPKSPNPAAFYSTPGEANSVKIVDPFAYIADGPSGLQIVDIIDPFVPVKAGSFEDVENAISIGLEGDYAYVGSTDDKLHILKKNDLSNIEEVTVFGIKDEPKDIDISSGYAYIAQGESGLEIINVKDPVNPASVPINQDLLLTDSQAVYVLENRQHIFIADGRNGLKVFDIDRPARPVEIFHFTLRNENGVARSVTIEGEYAFLAVENEGIYQFHILDLKNIVVVGSATIEQGQSIAAISASSGDKEIKRFYNYLAAGDQGLQTYEVIGDAKILYIGIYEIFGEATMAQVGRAVYRSLISYINGNPEPIPGSVWFRLAYVYVGLVEFLILAVIWLTLFAQFVLPVQTFKEGRKATARLNDSLWENHGPAVFAKDGGLVAKSGEVDRMGWGVARVDLNSAVVLERRTLVPKKWRRSYRKKIRDAKRKGFELPKARVEGPGVVFIQPYEKVRGVADLRTQIRIRSEVKAYTREGIEVNSLVWILFTLGQPPEVLDVTYDGERKAENLKVISLKNTEITTIDGQNQTGLILGDFFDELDSDDKDEIHLIIQGQILKNYYLRVRTLATQMNISHDPLDILEAFVDRISQLAERLEIYERKEIQEFLYYVKDLVEKNKNAEPFDISTVQIFVYNLVIQIDRLTQAGMEAFHRFVHRVKVEEYKRELQAMGEPQAQVIYALREMDRFEDSSADRTIDNFCLNALRTLRSIEIEINVELRKLGDDDYSKQQRALLSLFRKKLAFITGELHRVDYPLTHLYSSVADLYMSISKIIPDASQLEIQDIRRYSNLVQNLKIRRMIGKFQKGILELEDACISEMGRYPDLVKIFDYVEVVRQCVVEVQNSNDDEREQNIVRCIRKVKRNLINLEQIIDSAYRRPVTKIHKITNTLDYITQDSSEFYFFGQKIEDIYNKIESAEEISIRSFLRRSKPKINTLNSLINQITVLVDSGSVSGVFPNYQERVATIKSTLNECSIPDRLIRKNVVKQVRVGPYLFDRKRVLAAIYSDALDVDRAEGEDKHMHWTKLPVHVATQIVRDMVSREQYDNLYKPTASSDFQLPLLKGNIRKAVRNKGVLAYRFIDHIEGEALKPGKKLMANHLKYYDPRQLKNPKVLRARGIKVIASGFPDLFPVSKGVPAHQLDYWRAPWQRDSSDIRSQYQLKAERVINQSRALAQRDMAYKLARILQSSHSEEALAMRVFQALEAAASDENVRKFLPRDTVFLLQSFREWFGTDSSVPSGDEKSFLYPSSIPKPLGSIKSALFTDDELSPPIDGEPSQPDDSSSSGSSDKNESDQSDIYPPEDEEG
ncbi:hypothetical protein ACFLXI_04830 [Chloroflexota bacterium]